MAYTYSLVAPSPPWLTIATVNNRGVITGDRNQVPATGYQGFYRVRAWDGVNEQFIQGPIDIAPRVNAGGVSLYQIDYQQSESITWGVAIGGGFGDAASGGGGGTTTGDFENMAFNFAATGALLSTKPTAAGTEGEVRHEFRRQTFADQSFLGGGDNRISVSGGVGLVGCTIERSGIWQYSTAMSGGLGGEWILVSAPPIEIVVQTVAGVTSNETPYWSPALMGVAADRISQMLHFKHYDPAGNNELAGWAGWLAIQSHNSAAIGVGPSVGAAGTSPYWRWVRPDVNNYSEF